MILLNTMKFDKDYSTFTNDMKIEYIKSTDELGMSEGFYGGNVDKVAKIKDSPVYLMIDSRTDGLIIKDIAVDSLEQFDMRDLKELAKHKGIEFKPIGTAKEDLLQDILKKCLQL